MKIFRISIVLLVSISLFSCKKDRIQKSKKEYENISTYLDLKKQQEQVFVIDTLGETPIIGNLGTKILISKDCLMRQNGDSVYFPYMIKLVELYSPKDMIYHQMPSVSSQGVLQTDGEIRLRAFKGNEELLLRPDPCQCEVHLPNENPKTYMRVFYGFENNGIPNWTSNLQDFGIISSLSPFFETIDSGYKGHLARLGWFACDAPIASDNGAQLTFTSTTDVLENIGIFIYLNGTNSLIQVYNMESIILPLGYNAKIICLGIDSENRLYQFYKELIISQSEEVDVEMTEISETALESLLSNL